MSKMKALALVAGTTAALCTASCQRPADRDAFAPGSTSTATTTTTTTEGRNIGEGEREQLTNAEIVERFARDIKNDPTIAQSSNVSLILAVNGELVLQGTAMSDDVKDEIEDYAEKLAGRDVRNDIEVAAK